MRPALLGGVGLVLFAGACWWKSPRQHQRDYAQSLAPAEVPRATSAKAQARVFKVRVYADQDHRAQVLDWELQARDLVERANEVLADFDARLVIESLRPWERRSSADDVFAMLEELTRFDAAPEEDVAWVLGFVRTLSVFSATLEQLGAAYPLGKHMVMRGMNDVAEMQALADVLHLLPVDERSALYAARKRHKELAILMHEIGHSVGAVHSRDLHGLMRPIYDAQASTFGERNRELVRLGLTLRAAPNDPEAWARVRDRAVALLREDQGRELHVEEAEQLAAFWSRPLSAPVAPLDQLTQQTYESAAGYLRAGETSRAQTLVDAMLARHPEHPLIVELACQTAAEASFASRGGDPSRAIELCHRAGATATPSLAGRALEARLLAERGADTEALRVLQELTTVLDAEPQRQYELHHVTVAYMTLGCVESALSQLERVKSEETKAYVEGWALEKRRSLGLPKTTRLNDAGPANDCAYASTLRTIRERLGANALAEARAMTAEALSRFPALPGLLATRCEIEARAGKLEEARRTCNAAVGGYDETLHAHYMLGRLATHARDRAAAVRHFERLIELDPSREQPWRELAAVLVQLGRAAEVEALHRRFAERFGRPLQGK